MKLPAVGITCYPTQGGSGVVATELGLHLARRGCAVHFISSALPFRLRKYQENISYHQVEMPQYPVFQNSPYTLSLASVMAETAVREGLDIMHVHYAIPHAASAYLAQQMVGADRLKVVTTLHGTDITLVGQEPSFFPITKFMIEKSDAVTAVSTFLKDETVKVFGIEREIEVIPNFVDARVFQPRPSGEPRRFAEPGEVLVVHASNFRPVKNVQAVIDTFAEVVDCPVKLLLLGDGPEQPLIRKQVQERGLADRVRFLGQTDNLEDVLPEADVLLLPSLHESFGLVALEAMACGVVPIVTDRGGTGEFVTDGFNGFLRDPEDIVGMAEALRRLATDTDCRRQMAEEARREASGEFGVSCILRRYIDLYDRWL